MDKVLCSITTFNRYDTTLPMVLSAVIHQTRSPDKIIIFDDNKDPKDLRDNPIYKHLFAIMDEKKIPWEVVFGKKKGQHYSHQTANRMGYDWVWRVDDDCVPEPNVLENLMMYTSDRVGAVGGSILTPPVMPNKSSGIIGLLDQEPNIQWGYINDETSVDHLHCSFIYRAGVHDFHLGLSQIAHREETLFTYGLRKKGYLVLVVPDAISWHLKAAGGIRSGFAKEMWEHDERIFRNLMTDKTIVVLNCGMGDHVVFSHVLPEIKNPEVFTCYPDIIPGRSIAEAMELYGNIDNWNIYAKMDQWDWTDSLENAFREMYL